MLQIQLSSELAFRKVDVNYSSGAEQQATLNCDL